MERSFNPTYECVPDHPSKGMCKDLNYTQMVAIQGTSIGNFRKKANYLRGSLNVRIEYHGGPIGCLFVAFLLRGAYARYASDRP